VAYSAGSAVSSTDAGKTKELVAAYEVPRIQVRRSLRRNPSAEGKIVFVLDDKGTVATFPTGESRLDWRACIKYKETAVLRTPVPVSLRPAIIEKSGKIHGQQFR